MTADPHSRLAELQNQYGFDATTTAKLRKLLDIVASDPTAPTTVADPAAAVDVHIADSLSGLAIDRIRHARAIADIGAGAGFPGLVLAAVLPRASVTELESVAKKCDFMRRAADHAGLTNVTILNARAEEGPQGSFDVVTARALAPLNVLAEYAAPLLAPDGVLVAWKGARDGAQERAGEVAAAELGLESRGRFQVKPWEGVEARHLYVYAKVTETPPRFPRRPGMARKRPLGGST